MGRYIAHSRQANHGFRESLGHLGLAILLLLAVLVDEAAQYDGVFRQVVREKLIKLHSAHTLFVSVHFNQVARLLQALLLLILFLKFFLSLLGPD